MKKYQTMWRNQKLNDFIEMEMPVNKGSVEDRSSLKMEVGMTFDAYPKGILNTEV